MNTETITTSLTQTAGSIAPKELEGEELKIYTYPSPILKKVAKPVEKFDSELKNLVKNMLFTMYQAPGIGLAAPQVGISKRIFVMDIDYDREEVTNADGESCFKLKNFNPRVIINPVFKEKKGETLYEEGCLSVPGVYEKVKRASEVVLEYCDTDGNTHTLETDGLLSVCLQHENDHLDGVVFLERLSTLKRQFLTQKYLKKKNR